MVLGVLAAALVAVAMAMVPSGIAKAATQICSNQTGTNGGMYYQMWSNGQGSACITLNSASSYSTTWSGIGDFVAGVGWSPGSSQTVSFTGSLGRWLKHLDRDGEHGGPGGRLLHLERQRHLPQPVRHEGDPQRQRQQLGLHGLAQRPVDMAVGLL
jgi:hypothetical protein